MNRTIWIWRMIAILIILIFTILMWNLYARLTRMQPSPQTETPSAEEPSDVSWHTPDRILSTKGITTQYA